MDPTRRSKRGRKGQTLAEFALTLPILLIMIFGIIEFGRIFQAWVSLQNAARTAARYASTGAVNYNIFQVAEDEDIPLDIRVLDTFVPCDKNDDNGGLYDDIGTASKDGAGVTRYEGGTDSLFATWYDGTDCDPTNEDHQQFRKDMLRIASIMYEARESVNALSVEGRTVGGNDSHYFKDLSPADFQNLLYTDFADPMVRVLNVSDENRRAWFDIQICSSRGLLDPVAGTNRVINPVYGSSRFVTVRSSVDLPNPDDVTVPEYPRPYCMLNEIPPPPQNGDPTTSINNAGFRWLDAGSAGDRVTIVVTFNHPLITPLRTGAENYLKMQARRSIVNESFRAPKAIGAFQRSLPPGNTGVGTPLPPVAPTNTLTPTDTPTNTKVPTNTPTDTPEPFTCDNVTAYWGAPPFDANRMFLIIN
ncbi:MAG TPA: TadE family protein, partial [Phototrophicaceae bacterium]|nr:TadE family protein [Phototrophicaceae bacterium]